MEANAVVFQKETHLTIVQKFTCALKNYWKKSKFSLYEPIYDWAYENEVFSFKNIIPDKQASLKD